MSKGGGAPAAPDMSGLIQTANNQANRYNALMEEELQFSKDAYAHQLPYTDKIQDLNLKTAQDASDFAASQRAQYQNLYQPLAEQFVDTAKDYTSEDKMARARGTAMSAVGQQFDVAGDASKRSLESYGIDPSATRYAALDIGTRTAKAAATAAAGTKSDVDREATGLGLQTAALNIGNGLPGQVSAAQNTGTAAGAAGVGAGNNTYSAFSNALGNPQSFGQLGNTALQNAGSLTSSQYQNQLGGYSAGQSSSSGLGSLLGGVAGIASLFLEDGGAVPMAGQAVPPAMSPSGGAQTDDVPATVNGSALPVAAINTDEFIFPKDVAKWFGEEKLQKMIVKARQDKANAGAQPQQGAQPQGPAQPSAPPSQALQTGPRMAGGGSVPAVAALPIGPSPSMSAPRMAISASPRPYHQVKAAPGAGGGAGRQSALPVGRPRMPAPYPGGSGAGAVRSAIPGV